MNLPPTPVQPRPRRSEPQAVAVAVVEDPQGLRVAIRLPEVKTVAPGRTLSFPISLNLSVNQVKERWRTMPNWSRAGLMGTLVIALVASGMAMRASRSTGKHNNAVRWSTENAPAWEAQPATPDKPKPANQTAQGPSNKQAAADTGPNLNRSPDEIMPPSFQSRQQSEGLRAETSPPTAPQEETTSSPWQPRGATQPGVALMGDTIYSTPSSTVKQ